ncbi:MAG: spermidine synthase [Lentimonas sp.]|jgi:spermidine synthase
MTKARHLTDKQRSLLLGIAMFTMGGCGLAYEYTLSKIASDLLGNSVQQWAIIIALMLFFMGIGADLQQYIEDKKLIGALVCSQIILGIAGGFGSILILFSFSLFPAQFIIIQYGLISIIGLMIGFEIPLLTRINQFYSEDVKTNIARILKMDYIGALCGALFWVFVLPRYFTMVETGYIIGLITLATTALCLVIFKSELAHTKRLWLTCALSSICLCVGFSNAKGWTHNAEQYLYRDRIVFSETTKYQHIVITESPAKVIACYINGHLQFNDSDEYIYHENLVHPAMQIALRRKNILILGGGDGLAAREVLKYEDVETVTLVDLDPLMTELARTSEFFLRMNRDSLNNAKLVILENGALIEAPEQALYVPNQKKLDPTENELVAQVSILNVDAAKFVAQAKGKYDVIIIDFPDPNAIELAKLYSQHFYGLLRNKLAADGIFVQQSTSPVHASEAYLCIGRTMESANLAVLPYHDNVPSFGEWGWWIGGRDDRYSPSSIRSKIENIPKISVETDYLTLPLIRGSLAFGKGQLDSANKDINTITSPKVYDYYLQGWRTMNGR